MRPVEARIVISAPRADVFDFVSDIANRPAWHDHYLKDFRLAHPRSSGKGAAARYLVDAPLSSLYLEVTIVEAEPPRRIVERAHGGRNLRTKGGVSWELSRAGQGLTRVEVTQWIEPGTPRVMHRSYNVRSSGPSQGPLPKLPRRPALATSSATFRPCGVNGGIRPFSG